jgi:hypothetical protein
MDYQKSKIYQITDIAYTKMYIGSTTQSLSRRFSKHKAGYKLWQDGKTHKYSVFDIFNEFGVENCKIELLEEFSCNNRMELERKEGDYIRINNCVNRIIAGRTDKEYYQDHKEDLLKQMKEYRQDHKEQIKQYYQDHKEDLLKQMKEYYHDHKEQKNQPNKCDCGGDFTTFNKSNHNKTSKHQNYLLEQKNKIRMNKYSFQIIFECDSNLRRPRTYPNYVVIN